MIAYIILTIMQIPLTIFDFQDKSSLGGWYVVNDGVMGGLSEGQIAINEEGHAHFHGYVTTENKVDFPLSDTR